MLREPLDGELGSMFADTDVGKQYNHLTFNNLAAYTRLLLRNYSV